MEQLDLREKGGVRGGEQQTSDRRLFMQLLAFGNAGDTSNLIDALEQSNLDGVLYEDANDPRGIGLLTWSENPDFFVDCIRPFLNRAVFAGLALKPEYTMMGRTYSIGYEPNLEEWLLQRSPRVVTNAESRWHVWYPLRRKGEFNSLPVDEQMSVLREHGKIGHSFGEAGYAQDVRLACFGMDRNDNDFVIGLIGKDLFPLSACVQAMRRTRQTSSFMQEMGPFFIGRAIWQRLRS
ncbi:MAG TPA: chlorite dismutase family protein [Bryobacteraceae bacterium]|nr:chlorite dismutase family protein [Bryobacteraceae bacterium]